MNFNQLTIAKKLRLLVGSALAFLLVIGFFGLYQLYSVDQASQEIRSNWMPSIQYLSEANAALANHRMKTYKHITLQKTSDMSVEEEALQKLFDEANVNVKSYSALAYTPIEKEQLATITEHIDAYIKINQSIIALSRQNLYDSARAIIYTTSFKEYTVVNSTLKSLLKFNIEQSQIVSSRSETIFGRAIVVIGLLIIVCGVAIIFFGRTIISGIKSQLSYLQAVFTKLAKGDVNVSLNTASKDEIGILSSDIGKVICNLQDAAGFSRKIGEGNLDTSFQILSEQDVLGLSLTNMQTKLKAVSEEDKSRNWATQGLAQVGDILRVQYSDQQSLYDQLIRFVVNYSKATQGGLFLISDGKDKALELIACCAYDRKKFQEKKILPGEGLVGQVYLEQQTRYLIDVPNQYVSITSGLGGANPTSILITPLKVNEEVIGVLELASFNRFEKYEIQIEEKLAESIAAAIVSVRTNERTKQLLETTLQQTEEMRAQEEEVRQNLEELTATQEEMNRKSMEFETRFEVISRSNIATIEFDLSGVVIDANRGFLDTMGYSSVEEIVGRHHRIFVDKAYANTKEYTDFWYDLAHGNTLYGEFDRVKKDGSKVKLYSNYDVIKDANGSPVKVMKVAIELAKFKVHSNGILAHSLHA